MSARAIAGSAPARRARDGGERALARRFGDALRVGDPAAAEAAIDAALNSALSAPAVQSRVIAPAMRWIGGLWEQGVISVADEHLATALSYHALMRIYPRLLRRPIGSNARVALAAADGEQHVLGLRMAADALEGAGFDVRFLGGGVPALSLEAWIIEYRPTVVALGLTMPHRVSALARQLQNIHEFDPNIRLVIGGQGIPPVMRRVHGLCYAPDTERLVQAVSRAIAEPRLLCLPAGLTVAGGRPANGFDKASDAELASPEARLAATTAAATETARAHARRAFSFEQLELRDPTTELWNRKAFDEHYDQLLSAPVATGPGEPPPALLIVDVDGLEAINDQFGARAGDGALARVAGAIASALRHDDVPARYGGDEFAVLLPNTGTAEALAVGERIRARVEHDRRQPRVTVSIGVTIAGAVGSRRRASLMVDQALHAAKQAGCNQVALSVDCG